MLLQHHPLTLPARPAARPSQTLFALRAALARPARTLSHLLEARVTRGHALGLLSAAALTGAALLMPATWAHAGWTLLLLSLAARAAAPMLTLLYRTYQHEEGKEACHG